MSLPLVSNSSNGKSPLEGIALGKSEQSDNQIIEGLLANAKGQSDETFAKELEDILQAQNIVAENVDSEKNKSKNLIKNAELDDAKDSKINFLAKKLNFALKAGAHKKIPNQSENKKIELQKIMPEITETQSEIPDFDENNDIEENFEEVKLSDESDEYTDNKKNEAQINNLLKNTNREAEDLENKIDRSNKEILKKTVKQSPKRSGGMFLSRKELAQRYVDINKSNQSHVPGNNFSTINKILGNEEILENKKSNRGEETMVRPEFKKIKGSMFLKHIKPEKKLTGPLRIGTDTENFLETRDLGKNLKAAMVEKMNNGPETSVLPAMIQPNAAAKELTPNVNEKLFSTDRITSHKSEAIIEQVTQHILQNMTANQKKVSVSILDHDLGKFDIKINRVDHARVEINIETFSKEAQKFFNDSKVDILTNLVSAGLKVDTFKVESSGNSNPSQFGEKESSSNKFHSQNGTEYNRNQDQNGREDSRRRANLWSEMFNQDAA